MAKNQFQPMAVESSPRFHCKLACPTPLAHAELVVEAKDESEAKEKYFAANGISGSFHEFQIRHAKAGE